MKLPNEVPERNQSDWSGLRPTRPMLLTLPKTNIEVSKILEFCNKRLIPVVPQGGMTGLVSGAHPGEDEVAVSFERMTGVEEIDPVSNTLTALSYPPVTKMDSSGWVANPQIWPSWPSTTIDARSSFSSYLTSLICSSRSAIAFFFFELISL